MDSQAVIARAPALGFTSDNIAGASPEVIEAIAACNAGQTEPYGKDTYTARVERKLAELFERDVAVFLVPTGTAANALCLSVMSPPWGSIFCHPDSHINNDECGAPEFYTDGAKIVTVDGPAAKLDPEKLAGASRKKLGDIHATQPACVSITQATEIGSIYSVEEIRAIAAVCKDASMRLHMDGARFANALVSLNCTPAEMTWKAGVSALSFGATKNGVPCAEAIILFDESLCVEMGYRRKRAGHLFSKMRFLSAQIDAYLHDDLWLRNARQANAMAMRLENGLRRFACIEPLSETQSNILFCRMPQTVVDGLRAAGFGFYDRWEPGIVRFVTSFSTTPEAVDNLLANIERLVGHCG